MIKQGLAGVVLTLCLAMPVRAEEVSLPYNGLTLDGHLTLAEGSTLRDGVVLMVHGTLAHNRMEIISTQQALLQERGMNSLAITLSLNIDNRRGPYDCGQVHTHRHFDAIGEIKAWLAWLKEQKTPAVTLFGHSRGGNQVAMVAAEHDDPIIANVVLAAPQTWSLEAESDWYKNRYGVALQPIMGKALAATIKKRGDQVMEGVDFIYCPKAKVTAKSFVGYYVNNERLDTPHIVDWIEKPVMVVVAGADSVVPDLAAKMAQVKGDNVRVEVIEDGDHMFLDFNGEDLADMIADFAGGAP